MRTTAPESSQRGRLAQHGLRAALSPLATALFALCCAFTLPNCFDSHGTVGAVIAQEPDTGRLFLREVPPGLAASRAGLRSGDEILLIDGVDVRAMDSKQLHAVLTGEVDTAVKLTLVRDDQILRVTLKRTEAQKHKLPPSESPEAQH